VKLKKEERRKELQRERELLRALAKEMIRRKLPPPVIVAPNFNNQARRINRHSRLSKPISPRELRELYAELSKEIASEHKRHAEKAHEQKG
jgi:hypothetical protein